MGSVYRAVHVKTKDPVAVKIIAAQVADEPRFRRRFDAEVKTLMSLQHPGIVKLIGFGEEHGQLFYSMELVEGDSLQALIKRERKLSWKQSIDFAIEICTALKHAHDVGVIHRDLKPANLIVTSDHNVKLVDFGIAKIFGDQQQTVVGSMLGTLDYMAPEQVDSESITVRTDLYAVGSVLYCMLTGRPPFRGKNATQVLDMLKNQPPARLDLIDPDLPETLVELVHELLAKSPAQR
ncbi:MAG: serine/threonine protein kinase, partial [Rubripirellula sp.]